MSGGIQMIRKKWKRKSGYVSSKLVISEKEMIENELFLDKFYSDWDDWRDGFRDWFGDAKLIKKIHYKENWKERVEKRLMWNKKQKKLIQRRKIRKKIYK